MYEEVLCWPEEEEGETLMISSGTIRFGSVIWGFSASSVAKEIPNFCAIDASVSPGWTTYCPGPAVGCVDGILTIWPGTMVVLLAIWLFSASSAARVMLSDWAIDARVLVAATIYAAVRLELESGAEAVVILEVEDMVPVVVGVIVTVDKVVGADGVFVVVAVVVVESVGVNFQ